MADSSTIQKMLDISIKSTNGTATAEENTEFQTYLQQQVKDGKAKYDKATSTYTFDFDNGRSLSYSRDMYQQIASGKTLKQAAKDVKAETGMTADKCYKIIMSGTSNHTELDAALDYYARHYDEVNAIDSQDNSLRAQKGDNQTIKNKVLSDDYMSTKLAGMAQSASTASHRANTTLDTIYAASFLRDFNTAVQDSAITLTTQLRAQQVKEALLGNDSFHMSDQEDFKLPDMGDYYLGNVDTTYLDAISEAYQNKKDAQAAANYAEGSPEDTLGYYPDKDIYFLKTKVNITDENIKNGFFGVDFLTLFADQLSSAQSDNSEALKNFLDDISNKTKDYPMLAGNAAGNMFELKLLGINAPQVPRWAYEYNVPESLVQHKGLDSRNLEDYGNQETYVCSMKDIELLLSETEEGDSADAKDSKTPTSFTFVYINSKWHQAELISSHDGKVDFRWLIDPGVETGYTVSTFENEDDEGDEEQSSTYVHGDWSTYTRTLKRLRQLLEKDNGTIYIRFEGCGVSPDSSTFPPSMSNALIDLTATAQLQKMAEDSSNITASGLNRIHVQNCRRYLGEAYVKTSSEFGDVYINIVKYLLGTAEEEEKQEITYSADYEGKHEEAFTLQEYDIDSKVYADAFFETIEELDDRRKIQKELFNVDWDSMLDWNVTIGDVTFFVPPVNIRLQTFTHSERMSLLRTKGSAAKTDQRMNRVLSMDIFFNEDKGINGYAWETTLDDTENTPIIYSLNGLRAVVSMFRFTPFLPVSNNFINKVLGIDAIVVNALEISSVANYPKLIHATLTMTEFHWRTYMPDIVHLETATTLGTSALQVKEVTELQEAIADIEQDDTLEEDEKQRLIAELAIASQKELVRNSEYRNWFEKTINWKTFRYYYQRPIRRGDLLKTLGYDFNSEEYIYFTCGGLTSLVPMSFQDPGIKFYMANEDYLKEILRARYELLRTGVDTSQISFTDSQLEMLQAISALNDGLQTLVINEKFQQDLNTLNKHLRAKNTYFSDVADVINNATPDARYNQGCITNSMSNNPVLTEDINTCLAQVDQITEDARARYSDFFEPNAEYMSIIDKSGKKVSFAIAIKIRNGAMTDEEMDSFKTNLKVYLGKDPFGEQGNWEGFWDNTMNEQHDRIIIPISVDTYKDTILGFDCYKPKDNAMFKLNGNTTGMRLISVAKKLCEIYNSSNTTGNTVPDVNSLMNLVYDEYLVLSPDSPGFLVTNWRASMSNKVAPIRSLSSDGFAPQYLGGEDISITVNIQTQDKQVATMLTAIPKQISRLTRTYHLVMPCIPLRIDSEFSKFLGVNEVTCEEASISTEPGHPGLYNITMVFISMDRTIREREAANRKTINNSGWNYFGDDSFTDYGKGMLMGAGIGALLSPALAAFRGSLTIGATIAQTAGATLLFSAGGAIFAAAGACLLVGMGHVIADYIRLNDDHTTDGSFGSGVDQTKKYRQYFEMKGALAGQDLYPDLELPTIVEMMAVGFYFMRYKFQDERVYVDPDFYFIYPVKLTSHIYRELAIHGMEVGIADTTLTDATGACISVVPSVGTGFEITAKNPQFIRQEVQTMNRHQMITKFKSEQKRDADENLKKEPAVDMPFMSLLNLTMERDSWSVCDKIQGMFLEQKFLKEVRNYENLLTSSSAANVNETRGTSNKNNAKTADDKAKQDTTNKVNSDGTASTVQTVATSDGKTKEVHPTEGKFVYDELQNAKDAADTFYKWLSERTIEKTFSSMSDTADKFLKKVSRRTGDQLITASKTAVSSFLEVSEVKTFLNALKIDINDKFKDITSNIIAAAACAATGRKEFAGKTDSEDWKPDRDFIGVQLGTDQNTVGMSEILWGTDSSKKEIYYKAIVKRGIEFGHYRFKMYTRKELQNLLYKDEPFVPNKPGEEKPEKGNVNSNHYLLDPGYRSASVDVIEQYKGKCITDITYATYAYMRLVCYWLYRLVYMRAFPNISTDILRDRTKLEISVQDSTKKFLGVANSEVMVQGSGDRLVSLRKHIDFFSKNMHIIDVGKMWTAAVLATSEGDASLIAAIDSRNYDALNAVVETCATPSMKIDPVNNKAALTVRKMTLALIGLGVIDSMGAIGSSQTLPGVENDRNTMQKMFIDAAEDPMQFIPHSFHDMVVHDARGRMLRAFPTFYMCFIDEGREIGFWKLHDNFYNVNAISSIEVVKSRKLPTDVCTIVMSNFYNSFATEQEDYIRIPTASIEQAWNSIFSPTEYFKEQEVNRRNRPQDVKLRLRQGARIHVRMGYGNNAAMLPVMFNGVITEVSSEDTVKIIAQGDGIELLNPINIDKEAHNLPNEDDFFGHSASNGASPLQIATALFRTYGGLVNEQIRKRLKLNLTSRNPFGIVHFGDPDFTTFCKTGECCQNLYEMTTTPLYGGNADIFNLWYTMNDITRITFDLFQKTPWDVLNICKSISPDHKLAVLPFGFRSTVFLGMPHFYYAYDYYKDSLNVVKEKRKPFQQWHTYTAEQDIIGDGIVATNRDVKTVAVGLFQVCETFNTKSQQKVGPLYADWDIYNEAQRTMIVDTSLLGKGIPGVGVITNLFSTLGISTFSGGVDSLFDDTGFIASSKKIAWRSTADALKKSVMDMYAGDLIVFGDPSVKPQDRIFISDKYSGISGQALVKETVHQLSIDKGFTTAISPDCITIVNDDTELIKYEAMNRIGGIGAAAACLTEDLADSISWTSTVTNMASWAAVGVGATAIAGVSISQAAWQAYEWFGSARDARSITGHAAAAASTALRWLSSHVSSTTVSTRLTSLAAKLARVAGMAGVPILGQAAAVVYLAATLVSVMMMPFINSWLEQELKNYKVLTIFPLKKYGYAYTAGFEGARGTVYGSPTWGDRGSLGDVFDFLEGFPIIGTVGNLLFSDEVKELASKYQRDANIMDDAANVVSYDEEAGRLLGHIAGADTSFFANTYRSQQLQPRATAATPVAMTNSYNHFKKLDTKNWKNNLGENVMISQDARITPYLDEKFFLIVHESPGLPVDGQSVTDEVIDIGGKKYRIKAIHIVDGKGNAVVDVPLLNRQAINILYEILKRAKNYMPSANSTDPNEHWESTKNDYIALKSALRIGDRTSMGATGFTFILEGTASNSQRALKAALESLDKEIKSYSGQDGIQTDIFQYKQMKNGEVSVIVSMPQVGGQEEVTTAVKTAIVETTTSDNTDVGTGISTNEDVAVKGEQSEQSEKYASVYRDTKKEALTGVRTENKG